MISNRVMTEKSPASTVLTWVSYTYPVSFLNFARTNTVSDEQIPMIVHFQIQHFWIVLGGCDMAIRIVLPECHMFEVGKEL